MKATQFKTNQAELKSQYESNPDSAIQTLSASGTVDFDNLSFDIDSPSIFTPAGLHESSGGDGTFGCPVEIMLAGWAGCAGVTFAAVANAMRLTVKSCRITANGTMDFKGTLAVNKESPVGVTAMSLNFDIDSDEEQQKIDKLIELTERYCVVHQTFAKPPSIEVNS